MVSLIRTVAAENKDAGVRANVDSAGNDGHAREQGSHAQGGFFEVGASRIGSELDGVARERRRESMLTGR